MLAKFRKATVSFIVPFPLSVSLSILLSVRMSLQRFSAYPSVRTEQLHGTHFYYIYFYTIFRISIKNAQDLMEILKK